MLLDRLGSCFGSFWVLPRAFWGSKSVWRMPKTWPKKNTMRRNDLAIYYFTGAIRLSNLGDRWHIHGFDLCLSSARDWRHIHGSDLCLPRSVWAIREVGLLLINQVLICVFPVPEAEDTFMVLICVFPNWFGLSVRSVCLPSARGRRHIHGSDL